MTQVMIHQYNGEHGLGDRRRPDAHAGIMSTRRNHLNGLAVEVNRATRNLNTRGWLQRHMHHDVLTTGDAAEHAACVVRDKSVWREFIAVFATALLHRSYARADLNRLHRIDTHHGVRDIGIQSIKDGLAESRRHFARDHRYARAERIPLTANPPNEIL